MTAGDLPSGRHVSVGMLALLTAFVGTSVCGRSASASTSEPLYIDFTSSSPIGPGTTLTLTAILPATLRFDAGDGVIQGVDLLGASLTVTTSANSPTNNYYKAVMITGVVGHVGSFVVAGHQIDGAEFTSVEPGNAAINYARGVLMASIRLQANARGFPRTVATAYTSGQVISPTTVRLFMEGDSVLESNPVPALSVTGAVGMTLLLLMVACGVILRRWTSAT